MINRPKRRETLFKKIKGAYSSQTGFAYAIGENESYVSKVVNGWRLPDPARQKRWAKALGSMPSELFPEN
jgi:hypothetical protein